MVIKKGTSMNEVSLNKSFRATLEVAIGSSFGNVESF